MRRRTGRTTYRGFQTRRLILLQYAPDRKGFKAPENLFPQGTRRVHYGGGTTRPKLGWSFVTGGRADRNRVAGRELT